ncbi:hypothetical protein [Mycolicibacterium sp. CBMA 226]|jgi:hypothetical protein|uniref:hypothetical protein n=1 Tax=Mycolicibacterium sp. CBMA 226 TaxID=2606611 RepID=UPI0014132BE2|nr:hypothetical protein [Mycolicibacterium sp. CBMA 226]
MTARREAITLIVGAVMLVAATMTVHEAHERAQNTPTVSVGEHRGTVSVGAMQPGN